MDFDANRRGSIKSQMLKSFFTNSPLTSSVRTSTTKSSYKSSKKVVTSSGSKVAVFEAESQSFVASETIGGRTKTESSHAEAERYCELEKDEADDVGFSKNLHSLMGAEFGAIMDRPFDSLLSGSDDEQQGEDEVDEPLDSAAVKGDFECKFGICPDGQPCSCLDDCEIDDEESSVFEETEIVEKMQDAKIN